MQFFWKKKKILNQAHQDNSTSLNLWEKTAGWLFFILLFGISLFSAWVWYQNVYRTDWSEEKKQAFLSEQKEGTKFKQKEFEALIIKLKARQAVHGQLPQPIKDIFEKY